MYAHFNNSTLFPCSGKFHDGYFLSLLGLRQNLCSLPNTRQTGSREYLTCWRNVTASGQQAWTAHSLAMPISTHTHRQTHTRTEWERDIKALKTTQTHTPKASLRAGVFTEVTPHTPFTDRHQTDTQLHTMSVTLPPLGDCVTKRLWARKRQAQWEREKKKYEGRKSITEGIKEKRERDVALANTLLLQLNVL